MSTIEFNIPGAGPHQILLQSALDPISGPVLINGFTQPGSKANTLAIEQGIDAVLKSYLTASAGFASPKPGP